MSHTPYIRTEYLDSTLDPNLRERNIQRCVEDIKRSGVEFDAIAFTGVSGALVAPILAYELGKTLIVVRKPEDKSTHSHSLVEGDIAAKTYIIADDFVSSGKTLRTITEAVRKHFVHQMLEHGEWRNSPPRECVGVITSRRPYTSVPQWEYDEMEEVKSGGLRRTGRKFYYRNLSYREE